MIAVGIVVQASLQTAVDDLSTPNGSTPRACQSFPFAALTQGKGVAWRRGRNGRLPKLPDCRTPISKGQNLVRLGENTYRECIHAEMKIISTFVLTSQFSSSCLKSASSVVRECN